MLLWLRLIQRNEQLYFDIEDYLNEIVLIAQSAHPISISVLKDVTGAVWRPTAKHDYRFICIPK